MSANLTVTTTKGSFALNREIFADIGVSMRLPENLRDLAENEKLQKKAPSAAPEIIKADVENKIAFTISASALKMEQGKSESDALAELISVQQTIISRPAHGYQEYGLKRRETDGHIVACLSFKSNAIENDMYNVLYMCLHKEKAIFGTFSCPLADELEWDLVFLAAIDTIKFL